MTVLDLQPDNKPPHRPGPPPPPDPIPAVEGANAVPAAVTPVEKPAPLVEVVMWNLFGDNWKTDVQGFMLGFCAFVAACGMLKIDSFHDLFQLKTLIAVATAAVPIYVGKKQMDAKPKQ